VREQLIELVLVQRLLLEQRRRKPSEVAAMLGEQADRLLECLVRQADRRLVADVREVGAREAGCLPRDRLQVDVLSERLAARVDPENLLAAGEVRWGDEQLPVEAARAKLAPDSAAVGDAATASATASKAASRSSSARVFGERACLASVARRPGSPASPPPTTSSGSRS
jgi:hypothetical protein